MLASRERSRSRYVRTPYLPSPRIYTKFHLQLAQERPPLVLPIPHYSSDGSVLFAAHRDARSPCRSQGGSCLRRARHDHRDRVRYSSSLGPGYPCLKAVSRCSVYGITILQAYIYFRHNNASSRTRSFVSTSILHRTAQPHIARLRRSRSSCKLPVLLSLSMVCDRSQRARHLDDDSHPLWVLRRLRATLR